ESVRNSEPAKVKTGPFRPDSMQQNRAFASASIGSGARGWSFESSHSDQFGQRQTADPAGSAVCFLATEIERHAPAIACSQTAGLAGIAAGFEVDRPERIARLRTGLAAARGVRQR